MQNWDFRFGTYDDDGGGGGVGGGGDDDLSSLVSGL